MTDLREANAAILVPFDGDGKQAEVKLIHFAIVEPSA